MSAYEAVRAGRERPERVVALIPKVALRAVDHWGVTMGLPSRSETIRKLLEIGLMAAGADLGGHAPAAVKAQQNHSEAPSHAAE